MRQGKIDSIQVLRGVACLLVILFHYYGSYLAQIQHMFNAHNSMNNYFSFGAYGVQLFFMISGFIMYSMLKAESKGLSYSVNFLLRRFIRIWPVYVIATLFSVPHLNSHFFASILFWPFKSMQPPQAPTLGVAWTLSYEVYFYLILALILTFSQRVVFYLSLWFAISVIGLPLLYQYARLTPPLNGLAILSGNYQLTSQFTLLNFVTNFVNLYFIAGIYLACLYKYLITSTHLDWVKLNFFFKTVLLLSLTIMLYHISNYAHNIYIHQSVINSATKINNLALLSVLAAFFIAFIWCFKQVKFPHWLLLIGNMSYSLYLWQYFCLFIQQRLISQPSLFQLSLFVVLNLLISYISYKIIEIKLHDAILSHIKRRFSYN